MANWFAYLNKERDLLRTYYELKNVANTTSNSGDSGLVIDSSELFCMNESTSASSTSVASSSTSTANDATFTSKNVSKQNGKPHLLLNHLSIFEHEEYFNYFHNQLQLFNFIDADLIQLFKDTTFSIQQNQHQQQEQQQHPQTAQKPIVISRNHVSINPQIVVESELQRHDTTLSNGSTDTSASSQRKSNKLKHHKSGEANDVNQPPATTTTTTTTTNHHGSNKILKHISKKLNIKGWFSSSSSGAASSSSSASQPHANGVIGASSSKPIGPVKVFNAASSASNVPKSNNKKDKLSSKSPRHAKHASSSKATYSSMMKHSLSEPSINDLVDN